MKGAILKKQCKEKMKHAKPLPASIQKKAEAQSGVDLSRLSLVLSDMKMDAKAALYQNCIFQRTPDEATTLHEIGHYVHQHQGISIGEHHPIQNAKEEQEAEQFANLAKHTANGYSHQGLRRLPDQKSDTICFRLFIGNALEEKAEKALSISLAKGEKKAAGFSNYTEYTADHFPGVLKEYHKYKGDDVDSGAMQEDQTGSSDVLLKLEETETVTFNTDGGMSHNKINDKIQELYVNLCSKEKESYQAHYYFRDQTELFQYFDIKLNQQLASSSSTTSSTQVSKEILPKINMINIGTGDSILIRTPEHYELVDMGLNYTRVNDFLSHVTHKFQNEHGAFTISNEHLHVVITHGDKDHTGNIKNDEDLQAIINGNNQTGKDGMKQNTKTVICGASQYYANTKGAAELNAVLRTGGYEVLNGTTPLTDTHTYDGKDSSDKNKVNDGKNADSLPFIRIEEHEIQIFTGDIQMSGKLQDRTYLLDRLQSQKTKLEIIRKACIAKKQPLPVVLLKVPHHGSFENINVEFFKFMRNYCSRFIILISSKTKFAHPSASIFVKDSDTLYQQGMRVSFDMETDQRSDPEQIIMDMYYTHNLNDDIGSIVHKQSCDYKLSSTYTKTWVPKQHETISNQRIEISPNDKLKERGAKRRAAFHQDQDAKEQQQKNLPASGRNKENKA